MKRAREETPPWHLLPEEMWTLIFEQCRPGLLLLGAPTRTTVRALERAAPVLLARGIASLAAEGSPVDFLPKEKIQHRFASSLCTQLRDEARAKLLPYAYLANALLTLTNSLPSLNFYRNLKRLRASQLCNAWDCGKEPTGNNIFLAFRAETTHWYITAFDAYHTHLVHRNGKQITRTTPYRLLRLPDGRSFVPQPLSYWRTKWGTAAVLADAPPLVWNERRVIHTKLSAPALVDWINLHPERLAAREVALFRAVNYLQDIARGWV